jgi:hypothetical protein
MSQLELAAAPPPEPVVATSPAMNNRRGKTALALKGIAYLFLMVMLPVLYLVGFQTGEEGFVILAMGSSAFVCLNLWSLWLACRALWLGERAAWPMTLLVAFLFEASLALSSTWVVPYDRWAVVETNLALRDLIDWMYAHLLPVLIPFAAVCMVLLTPLAFRIVRVRERKALERTGMPWTRRKRWKTGALVLLIGSPILGFILLPAPLYVFSATVHIRDRKLGDTWCGTVLNATPQWARNQTDTILSALPGSLCRALHCEVLSRGEFSLATLQNYLGSTDPDTRRGAWIGLTERYPADAMRLALEALKTGAVSNEMAYLLGQKGDIATVRQLISGPSIPRSALWGVYRRRDCTALKPELLALARSAGNHGQLAAHILNRELSNTEQGELLFNLLQTAAPAARDGLLDAIALNNEEMLKLIKRLNHEQNPGLRRWLAWNAAAIVSRAGRGYVWKSGRHVSDAGPVWTEFYAQLLEDSDLGIRRGAMKSLQDLAIVPVTIQVEVRASAQGAGSIFEGADPIAEQPGEAAAFEQAKKDARKSLERKPEHE